MSAGHFCGRIFAIFFTLSFDTILCLRRETIVPFGKWRGMCLGDVQARFPQDLVDLSERRLFIQGTESLGGGMRSESGRKILLQPRDNVWDAVHEVISKQEYFQEVCIKLLDAGKYLFGGIKIFVLSAEVFLLQHAMQHQRT
jgi:hypothetical protein